MSTLNLIDMQIKEGAPKPSRNTPLPSALDKDFWGEDAEAEVADLNRIQPRLSSFHRLVWDGPHAVCTSCPYAHTIPLDARKYDIDSEGQIIRRVKTT